MKGRIRIERLKNIKFAVHIIRELIQIWRTSFNALRDNSRFAGRCTASGSEGPSDLTIDPKDRRLLALAFLELVRFLCMKSGARGVSLLQIEFRQAAVDGGASRI